MRREKPPDDRQVATDFDLGPIVLCGQRRSYM